MRWRLKQEILISDETLLTRRQNVFAAQEEDQLVIMDPAGRHYFALAGAGARVWEVLESASTFGELCSELSQEYDVPADVLEHDLQSLLRQLLAKHLIVVSAGSRSVTDAPPGFIRCFILLASVRAALLLLGLARTLAFFRRWNRTSEHESLAPQAACSRDEEARQVVTALTRAAIFFPARALCLEQSLALYVLLRQRGHRPTLKIGVQPLPFYAHAWVELGGKPLNEDIGFAESLVALREVSS